MKCDECKKEFDTLEMEHVSPGTVSEDRRSLCHECNLRVLEKVSPQKIKE